MSGMCVKCGSPVREFGLCRECATPSTGNEPKLETPGNAGNHIGGGDKKVKRLEDVDTIHYDKPISVAAPPDGPCPVCKTGKYVNGLHEPGEPTDDRCYCATWEEHKVFLDGKEPTKKKPEACQIDPRSNDACTHIYCSTHNKEAWEDEYEDWMSHLNWRQCICCQRAMRFKEKFRKTLASERARIAKRIMKKLKEAHYKADMIHSEGPDAIEDVMDFIRQETGITENV